MVAGLLVLIAARLGYDFSPPSPAEEEALERRFREARR